jgi:DnaJ-class molecular chaperone
MMCPTCEGKGMITWQSGPMNFTHSATCWWCHGRGIVVDYEQPEKPSNDVKSDLLLREETGKDGLRS